MVTRSRPLAWIDGLGYHEPGIVPRHGQDFLCFSGSCLSSSSWSGRTRTWTQLRNLTLIFAVALCLRSFCRTLTHFQRVAGQAVRFVRIWKAERQKGGPAKRAQPNCRERPVRTPHLIHPISRGIPGAQFNSHRTLVLLILFSAFRPPPSARRLSRIAGRMAFVPLCFRCLLLFCFVLLVGKIIMPTRSMKKEVHRAR